MLLHAALGVRRNEVLALVGGGGKTTLMFRLADELAGAGWRVVTTTTTRIFAEQMAHAPSHLVLDDEATLLERLAPALAKHGHVLLVGQPAAEAGKITGVPSQVIDRLAGWPVIDLIIVEGDGARRLPLKAPAEHEPVIPASTTLLVAMAGLDVIGRPLDAEHVHRPELLAALTRLPSGAPITPAAVAAALAHPAGGAKGLPPAARLAPFLNKAGDEDALLAAREVARRLKGEPRVERVVIGALQATEPVREVWRRTGVVVLAAGMAGRFGAFKQLLPWRGQPLVAHAADQVLACAEVDAVAVTLGAGATEVARALGARALRQVHVVDWQAGQSASVRAGLQALLSENGAGPLGACIFVLADQPGVSPELLTALVQRHRETQAPIVAPRHRGRRGNPVLFDAALFGEFAQLHGDVGARPLIQAHNAQVAWVEWPTDAVLRDIDTPADWSDLVNP